MLNQFGFSLYGMINYFELKEEPLFEDIELFEGATVYEQEVPAIDKDELSFLIEEQCGDLLCYRQIPDRFKRAVENFFKINYENFSKLWIALMLQYNPLENYDRIENWREAYNSYTQRTDTTHYKNTDDLNYLGSETNTEKPTGSEKNTKVQTGDDITTNYVSADSSTDWEKDTKQEHEPPTKIEDTLSFTNRETENKLEFTNRFDKRTFEHTYLDGNDKNDHKGYDDHAGRIHGNIGVMSSQKLVNESIELGKTNFYQYVTDLFEKQLMLQNY